MAEQPKGLMTHPKTARQVADDNPANRPIEWEPADATALQALVRGDCPPHLQQRAIKFIINMCGMRDLSYRYGGLEGDRDTAFAEGKRFIGLQIGKLLERRVKPGGEQE